MHLSADPLNVRVLTHNIRYATDSPFPGEELWPVRLPRLLSELQFHTRHIPETFICLQEALDKQLHSILDGLRTDAPWQHLGVGRDNGRRAGEYAAILYRGDIWRLINTRTFWLSETPDQPSKGWDAASVRLVTVGVFAHRHTRHEVVVLNTHLDDQGLVARAEAARMIVDEVKRWTTGSRQYAGQPVILAGDMNSTVDDQAYKILTKHSSPLRDVWLSSTRYGNVNTFSGFDDEGDGEGQKRIDFVFVADGEHCSIKESGVAVLSNRFDDRVFISDHRAVVADMVIRRDG